MTILYALLVLLVVMLVTTITSLYDLTISLFTRNIPSVRKTNETSVPKTMNMISHNNYMVK